MYAVFNCFSETVEHCEIRFEYKDFNLDSEESTNISLTSASAVLWDKITILELSFQCKPLVTLDEAVFMGLFEEEAETASIVHMAYLRIFIFIFEGILCFLGEM